MRQLPTILVAEDDANDALLMRLALEKSLTEVRVSVVSNGMEALKYIEGQHPYADRSVFPFPDLVLLDAGMPIMSGFQVLRWIREQIRLDSLPVVVLTNSMADRDAKLALEMGADAFVVKPMGLDELSDLLVDLTDRWVQGRQLAEAA